MRINKFIASNTGFSRRKADELISEGRVKINNEKIKKPGIDIDPTQDKVKIDDKAINIQNSREKIYLAFNKPAGVITSRSDELNRKTVMDYLPKIPNLKPVGRLDKNTEGLILASTDGEFINRHTHPKFECEKEYYVRIAGELLDLEIKKLQIGIMMGGKKTSPAKINIIKRNVGETNLKIVIHEGRNRQIRKMFDYISHPVKYLQRIRIGEILLGNLPKGKFRELTNQEIE